MKALSVRQPWAGLIATGRKTIEVRTWKTKHRGKLLICASRFLYPRGMYADECDVASGFELLSDIEYVIGRGVALCVVDLVDVRPVRLPDDGLESMVADIKPTDFAWEMRVLKVVQRVDVKGRLSLFDVDAAACPHCKDPCNDCDKCELFYCNRCDLWVPWEFGAADDLYALCDECWADVERKAG